MGELSLPALREPPFLGLVVPCFNEAETLPRTFRALGQILEECKEKGLIRQDSFACYVDDGSHDSTWNLIEGRHASDPFCRGVKFAGNAGHQNAVWAGMSECLAWNVDCIISLDADLQDDISVIPEMIDAYANGCDVVYGVRNSRASDTPFKRKTAQLFYALMNKLNVAMIPDHADYRLVARPALEALQGFAEHNLFLRGLFPIIGFKTAKVYYQRKKRDAGESKYPLRKMISFAWQGITSCSAAPLRVAGLMSFICMLIAIALTIVSLFRYIGGDTIPGWTSLIIVVLFLGSVQLFCLAIMGEYLAKIFTEVRRRPRYIIEKLLASPDSDRK